MGNSTSSAAQSQNSSVHLKSSDQPNSQDFNPSNAQTNSTQRSRYQTISTNYVKYSQKKIHSQRILDQMRLRKNKNQEIQNPAFPVSTTNQSYSTAETQKNLIKNQDSSFNIKKTQQKDTLKQTHKTDFSSYLQILQITEKEAEDFDILRKKFALKMQKYSQLKYEPHANIQPKRQERAKILLSFYHLSNKIYNTTYDSQSDQFLQAIFRGKTDQVKKMIDKNPQLLLFRTHGNNYPLLYVAAMTGHTDMIEMIIKTGRSFNFQKDRSTPFHAAAWYNHYHIAKILLDYGIPHQIRNIHGETPLQNAQGQIYDLLERAQKDKFAQLTQSMIKKKFCKTVINVQKQGQIIIRKIILKAYDQNFEDYIDAYHGTRLQNMESIAIYGIKKPGTKIGDKIIKVQQGNISLGQQFNGDKDWAGKIYASSSIHYAAQYSKFEYFNDENLGRQTGWKSIVQVKVKKGCYKQFGDTTKGHERVNNEPESLQYQIKDEKNVKVVALMLVKRNWLGHFFSQRHQDYNETSVIILQSPQESAVKKYHSSIVIPAPQD